MAEEIDCTSCGRRFTVKTFLRGMRVKCPHCRAQFGAQKTASETLVPAVMPARQVEPAIDLLSEPTPAWEAEPATNEYDVAEDQTILPAPLPPSKKRRKITVLVYRSKTREAGRDEMTPGQKGALRLGIALTVVGLASLILPLFGLQFRRLQNLGEGAWVAGLTLMLIGASVAGIALLRWRPKMTMMVGGGSVAALALLVVGVTLGPWMWRVFGAGGGGSRVPSRPEAAWNGPTMSSISLPASSTRPTSRPSGPPLTYDALAGYFGEENVVRIVVSGPDIRTVRDVVVYHNLARAVITCGAQRHTARPDADGRLVCLAAPVGDLDAVATALDLGPAPDVDRPTRTISVDLIGPAKGSTLQSEPASSQP